MQTTNTARPIAFFDSGIGGISLLKQTLQELPQQDYIYYADTENAPFGTKPRAEVEGYIRQGIKFLLTHNIKSLVLACNTATNMMIDRLRAVYDFPIVGLMPAIKPAVEASPTEKILVLATPITLREERFIVLKHQLDPFEKRIHTLPLPHLVSYAEKYDFNSSAVKEYLQDAFSEFHLPDYRTVVLGCTHFLYFRPLLKELLAPNTKIIDGHSGAIHYLRHLFRQNHLSETDGNGNIQYFESGKKQDSGKIHTLFNYLP